MAHKESLKSVNYAVEWWASVLKNGLTHQAPYLDGLSQMLIKLKHSSIVPSAKVLKRFETELTNELNEQLKQQKCVILKTTDYPLDLLKKCALNAGIYVRIMNPFPENITMQVTKESVLVKGTHLQQVVYLKKNCELEK